MLTYINQTVQYVWRAILKYKNRTTLYRKIWTGINYLLPQGYFIAGTHTTQRICVQCNVFNDLQGLFWGSNRVSEVKILSFFIRHFQWVKLLVCVKLYISGKMLHSGQGFYALVLYRIGRTEGYCMLQSKTFHHLQSGFWIKANLYTGIIVSAYTYTFISKVVFTSITEQFSKKILNFFYLK